MWEVAILIATVVGCVHMVHRYAFKQGHIFGIMVGRKQILEENLLRVDIMGRDNEDMAILVHQITDQEQARTNNRKLIAMEDNHGYKDGDDVEESRG